MDKTLILLALSRKLGHLCVAGIDIETSEWIRIVSSDSSTDYAVRKSDMVLEDGSFPSVGDTVRIGCKGHQPSYFQPENWVFDPSYYWTKLDGMPLNRIASRLPLHQEKFIFYDAQRCLSPDYIETIPLEHRYSLALVRPQKGVLLHIDQYANRPRNYRVTFDYRNNTYHDISVTDQDFCDDYNHLSLGGYTLSQDFLFVMSVGALFKVDNMHYKLIVQVFTVW